MPACVGEAVEPLSVLLDDVMADMKEGEVCRLAGVPQEMIPRGDLSAVPPGASITYTVILHSFQRAKPVWEMSTRELLCLARQHKDRGGQQFKDGHIRAAAVCYSRAAKLVMAVPQSEGKEAEEMKVALFLNLAACQLKLRQNSHVFENCSRVLELRRDSVKALYRRGVAAMDMGDLARAEGDLKEARRIEPGNMAVQRKQRELVKQRQLENSKLCDALRPMFSTP